MPSTFFLRVAACALPVVLLSACSGTTSGSNVTPAPTGPDTFDTAEGYFNAGGVIFDLIEDDLNTGNFDDPAGLPASGSVNYFGSLFAEVDITNGAIGAMRLTANFNNDSISGSVTDLVAYDDTPLTGSLDISNGVIDRTVDVSQNFTFAADLDGDLTDVDGDQFTIAGSLAGDFFNGAEQVYGEVQGTLSGPEGIEGVAGEFIAER